MERRTDIEDQINAALQSAKNIQLVELPVGFSDRVMNKLHAPQNNVRSLYSLSPLLRVAAMFILVIINMFALRLALATQPAPNPSQYATLKDFVNEYQLNDTNDELLTTNTPAHE